MKTTNLKFASSIFQACIPKKYDIRVTVIGEKVFPVEIHYQDNQEAVIDWRKPQDVKLVHQVHKLPSEIKRKCLEQRGLVVNINHMRFYVQNYKIKNNLQTILVAIFIGALVGIVATGRGTDIIGFFLVLLTFFALSVFLFRCYDSTLRNILLLAFVTRIVLALFQTYVTPLPDSGADAITFEKLGWEAAQAWLNGNTAPQLSGAYLYSALIGVLYYLLGRVPLAPQLLNVIIGILIVFFVYKLTLQIIPSLRSARVAAFLAAIFPTMNLYSAIIMRENIIVLLTVISVYCFLKWLNTDEILLMTVAVISLLGASALHGGMIVIGAVYIFFFSFYNPKKKSWIILNYRLLLGAILMIASFSLFNSFLLNKLPNDISILFSPEYLGSHTAGAARDRAAYLLGLTPHSFGDLIIQTPIRIIYFLLAPFPWMISSLIDLVGSIDAFLYLIFIIYGVRGLWYLKKVNKPLFCALLLLLIIFVVTFAWGTSNYGTAIRHRQKFVWLLISLASISSSLSSWWKWLLPGRYKPS